MNNLGEKIVIVGVSASGKSTFSRKLTEKINLPVIFMDSIMWNPGWQYIGDEETVKKLDEASARDKWIIEGYISTEARTFIFDRADTIVYLNYPPIIATWRYIKRCWRHRKEARPELKGNPDEFDFKFLKRIWRKEEAISLNKFLAQIQDQDKIITLTSTKKTQDFLRKI